MRLFFSSFKFTAHSHLHIIIIISEYFYDIFSIVEQFVATTTNHKMSYLDNIIKQSFVLGTVVLAY